MRVKVRIRVSVRVWVDIWVGGCAIIDDLYGKANFDIEACFCLSPCDGREREWKCCWQGEHTVFA